MTGASVFLLGLILTIVFAVLPLFWVDEEIMVYGTAVKIKDQ